MQMPKVEYETITIDDYSRHPSMVHLFIGNYQPMPASASDDIIWVIVFINAVTMVLVMI